MDFYTYESQPAFFLDEIWLMMQKQAEASNKLQQTK